MSRIQLFIAASIDGYIAREDHSIDWLDEMDDPDNGDYGYAHFIAGIDTVIMGRKTYDLVLGFDVDWPYADLKCLVVSSDQELSPTTPQTKVINILNEDTIQSIRAGSSKNIWLVGGGNLVSQFMHHEAIDDILLSVIPIVLGSGIPLFPGRSKETKFELINSRSYSTGAVMLNYKKKD